jgi:hypothetical protein
MQLGRSPAVRDVADWSNMIEAILWCVGDADQAPTMAAADAVHHLHLCGWRSEKAEKVADLSSAREFR